MTNDESCKLSGVRLSALLRHSAFVICSSFVTLHSSFAASPPVSSFTEWDAAAETLVIYNPAFDGSAELAKFYAGKRGIAANRVVGLKCSKEETISRTDFETTLREPLMRKLVENKWWEIEKRDVLDPNGRRYSQVPTVVRQNIKVLVLIRGVPLRIERAANPPNMTGMETDEASVDSELAALGPLLQRPIKGPLENHYYQSTRRFPDTYSARGQLIAGRLDAADDATVRRMIEDSLTAEHDGLWGRAVLDFALKSEGYEEGELWLARCVPIYHDNGIPVFTDRYKELIPAAWPLPDTILYFGWYADTANGALASPDFKFKRGAIACHLHSFSAATVRATDKNWVGPLLNHGAAAALGNVWEPFLTLCVHFDILNARLMDGFTLGEAAWAATPAVSWMNVVVGDPLYRPFPKNRRRPVDEKRDGDYALYQEVSRRYLQHDEKKFRRELLRLALEKNNPHILELGGLLCAVEGAYGEASDFFQHAAALYSKAADQLRCALYDAEIAKRKGDAKESLAAVRKILKESRFAQLPAFSAAHDLEMVVAPK